MKIVAPDEYEAMEKSLDLILKYFNQDRIKADAWINTPNPMFGDSPPMFLFQVGKGKKVLQAIEARLEENERL